MKTYRVTMWEEATWETNIEANSEEEARDKAMKMACDTGFIDWEVGSHGDMNVIDCEEIKQQKEIA
tara:strand:- start:43 stop:240 length:198 start_codon:yes stop_codon:yes gene_type:complete